MNTSMRRLGKAVKTKVRSDHDLPSLPHDMVNTNHPSSREELSNSMD